MEGDERVIRGITASKEMKRSYVELLHGSYCMEGDERVIRGITAWKEMKRSYVELLHGRR